MITIKTPRTQKNIQHVLLSRGFYLFEFLVLSMKFLHYLLPQLNTLLLITEDVDSKEMPRWSYMNVEIIGKKIYTIVW